MAVLHQGDLTMSVMNTVKEKIATVPFEQRHDLKYLWAELERAALSKSLTEADEYKVIEKLIADNEDTVSNYVKLGRESDPRISGLKTQTEVLRAFLPKYITKDELLNYLSGKNLVEHIGSKNGKSIGLITKSLKDDNLNFKNETVKEVVFG
jgi:uncharacterized protein YqeY